MFNDALSEHGSVQTRPCEDHSLDEMIAVRDVLLSAANVELNSIYESTNDRRRLSLASASPGFVPRDPLLAAVMRDALCVEAVNLYTHHLLEEEKAEFGALSALPLFPGSEHTREGTRRLFTETFNFRQDMARSDAESEFEGVFGKYEEALVCNLCHDIVTDPAISTPLAPRWPDEFKTSVYKRSLSNNYDPDNTDAVPDEVSLRQYSWPLRSTRDDTVFDDGSNRMIITIHTGCMDQYTDDEIIPDSQECSIPDPAVGRHPQSSMYYVYETDGTYESCTARDIGFGVSPPFWMQLGGHDSGDDIAFREEDVVVNGILCEQWNRQKPGTLDDHKVYWDRSNEVPVRRESEGGARVEAVKDYTNFQRDATINPDVFRPPRFCLTQPVDYFDSVCLSELDPTIPAQDWLLYCPTLRAPTPGPLQPVDLNLAGGAESAENSGVGTASIVGLTIAGTLFAVAGAGATRRFRETRGDALRGSQLVDPVLNRDAGAKHYEMGEPSRNY
jgi:hypothetical protein